MNNRFIFVIQKSTDSYYKIIDHSCINTFESTIKKVISDFCPTYRKIQLYSVILKKNHYNDLRSILTEPHQNYLHIESKNDLIHNISNFSVKCGESNISVFRIEFVPMNIIECLINHFTSIQNDFTLQSKESMYKNVSTKQLTQSKSSTDYFIDFMDDHNI